RRPGGIVRGVSGATESGRRRTTGGRRQDGGVVPEDGGNLRLHVLDMGARVVVFGRRQAQSRAHQLGELAPDPLPELFEARPLRAGALLLVYGAGGRPPTGPPPRGGGF